MWHLFNLPLLVSKEELQVTSIFSIWTLRFNLGYTNLRIEVFFWKNFNRWSSAEWIVKFLKNFVKLREKNFWTCTKSSRMRSLTFNVKYFFHTFSCSLLFLQRCRPPPATSYAPPLSWSTATQAPQWTRLRMEITQKLKHGSILRVLPCEARRRLRLRLFFGPDFFKQTSPEDTL